MIYQKITDVYFALAGVLAISFLLYAIFYTGAEALKKKKSGALLTITLVIAIILWPSTRQALLWAASGILVINSAFYLYFLLRFLLKKKNEKIYEERNYPAVTILIPAKNEGRVIGETLDALCQLDYPPAAFEVIVIDDCSDDDTPSICRHKMMSMANLKLNSNASSMGKALALNNVLETISSEYVIILDADHLISSDFIRKMLVNFADEKVACVQGKCTVRNGNASFLSRLIQLEYAGWYEVMYPGKPMALFLGSGAMFRTRVLKQIGGFNQSMLTEDLEISYRIHESGNRLVMDNSMSTYELACVDLVNFFKQRHRWCRGIWQSFIYHVPPMIKTRNVPPATLLYFFFVIIENTALTSYLLTNAAYALDYFGWMDFQMKPAVQLQTVVLGLILGTGALVGKKPHLLLFLPFALFYYVLFSLPNLVAMADNMILKTPYKWNKTDRSNLKKAEVIKEPDEQLIEA